MGVDKVVEGGNGHLQIERGGGRRDGEGREGGREVIHTHTCTLKPHNDSIENEVHIQYIYVYVFLQIFNFKMESAIAAFKCPLH